MNLEAHVEKLNQKHAEIERTIQAEEHRPQPDNLRIMLLKRQKLRLKEQLSKYQLSH